jgi:capsule biosynthesis phosphatase
MNILIPMGGIGHRFSRENYRFPKPLVKIVGRPMLFWLLDHLNTKEDDIIYIGITENLDKQFDLIQTLKVEYPKSTFQAIVLDFETRGAAETLFIMLQSITKERLGLKTISLDCDTIYFKPIIEEFRRLPDGMNASFFFEDSGGKPIYSYLKFNSNSTEEGYPLVTDVAEKIMVSSHANTGAYAFRSACILKQYCIQLLDEAVGHSGEYYTTNILKLMINNQERFVGIPVNADDFVCVGTPDQLNQFLKKLKTKETPVNIRKMRFCFDLDNTLVSYPTKYGDYNSVQPKMQNIQLIRELHAAGHYIIIQTARRMKTHKANIGAVIADVGRITMETLAKFDIPYDELLFGKPYADVYVDDSAVHALIDTAKEIGWSLNDVSVDSRDQNRMKGFISSRHFHTIQHLDNLIIKSSSIDCLQGEIYFYQNIPSSLIGLFPQLHRIERNTDADIASIVMERINGITYSHLFTNLCLTNGRLLKLLASLKRIHLSVPTDGAKVRQNIYANYSDKVLSRYNQHMDIYKSLDEYFKEHLEPSMIMSEEFISCIIKYLNEYEASGHGQHSPVIHGDPVFSNALLTPDSRVVFLDMRGCLGTVLSLEGDLNYDLAKVYQSLTGYDFILLNKGHLLSTSRVEAYLSQLVKTFEEFILNEYANAPNLMDLKMITVQLYISLIPLHNDFQQQTQFYKLALKLYHDIVSNKLNCSTGENG